jgi:hypothetical protein
MIYICISYQQFYDLKFYIILVIINVEKKEINFHIIINKNQ